MAISTPWKDDVVSVFADGGTLSKLKPGYKYSQKQTDLARMQLNLHEAGWKRHLSGGTGATIAIAEAATGIGKSIASLFAIVSAVARTRERGLVSTHTLALQKQYFGDKLPLSQSEIGGDMGVVLDTVEKLYRYRPTVAIRRGARNFLDVDRLQKFMSEMNVEKRKNKKSWKSRFDTQEKLDRFEALCRDFLAFEPEFGLIDEFWETREQYDIDDFRAFIPNAEICIIGKKSSAAARKKFDAHVEASKTADILVVPHVFSIMHARYGFSILNGNGDKGSYRPIRFALYDEADRLPDAAESFATSSLSLRIANKHLEEWLGYDDADTKDATIEKIADLLETSKEFDENMKSAFDNYKRMGLKDFHSTGDDESSCGFLMIDAEIDRKNGPVRYSGRDAHIVETIDKIVEKTNRLIGRQTPDDILETLLEIQVSGKAFLAAVENQNDLSETTPVASVSWSPKKNFVTFGARSLMPARILSMLWNPLERREDAEDADGETVRRPEFASIMFVSASLSGNSTKDDFARAFCRQIGIFRQKDDVDAMKKDGVFVIEPAKFEPEKFGKMHIRIVHPEAPNPTVSKVRYNDEDADDSSGSYTSAKWLDMAAASILKIAHTRGRGTLVLLPSKKDVRDVLKRIKNEARQADIAIIDANVDGKLEEMKKAYIRAYESGKRTLWISASAWVGLDLPGMIDNLIIGRLPIVPPNPIDDRIAYRLSQNSKKNLDFNSHIWNIRASKTFSKLRQGIGRGIRRFEDKIELTVLDPRFPIPQWLQRQEGLVQTYGKRNGTSRFFGTLWRVLPKRFADIFEDPREELCEIYNPPGFVAKKLAKY